MLVGLINSAIRLERLRDRPTMETERAKRLADFVLWVAANIKGDEKGEAQVFLDRFFQAFGHAGLREAGAMLEERSTWSQHPFPGKRGNGNRHLGAPWRG